MNVALLAVANSTNILFTTAPTLVGGNGAAGTPTVSIIPGAIGASGAAANTSPGTDFLTYPTTGSLTGIRTLSASEYTSTPASNVNLRLIANRTADDTVTINSLLLSGGITYDYDSTGGTNTLTLRSGSILSLNGANTLQASRNPGGGVAFGTTEAKIFAVNDFTFGAGTPVTGTGGLTVYGSGVVLMNRSVAISGGLTVNSGTLRSGAANAFSTAQALIVRPAGTFDLNGFNNTITTLALDSGATSGASITTGAGILTINSSMTGNINGAGTIGSSIAGNVALGAAPTITVNDGVATNDLVISAILSGGFGIIKAGSGQLSLSGLNTYTGTTTINAGTLNVTSLANVNGGSSSLGAPTTVANGTIGISATGILQYTGVGNTTDRVINLSGSGATVDASGNGTLTLTGGITGNTFNLNLIGSGSAIESGVINTTTGSIIKNGTGTWTLAGANTYTGTTTINNGILAVTNTQGLGTASGGATTVNAGSLSINLGGATLANTALLTLNGTGSSTLGSALYAAGSSGTDVLSNAITLGSSSMIGANTGATLSLLGNITNGGNLLTFTGTGNVVTSGVISGSGGLTMNGVGTLTLSNVANTYTGATIINSGSVSVAKLANFSATSSLGAAASGAILLGSSSAATLIDPAAADSSNRSITIGGTGGGTIQANTGTLTLSGAMTTASGQPITFNANGGNIIASGSIAGAGNLTASGSSVVTLSGANTYSGATLVNASATLSIANIAGLGNTTSTTVASGATLNINLNNATLSNTNAVFLNGTGISGNGALTFSGTNTTLNNAITLNSASLIGGSGTGTMTLGGSITGANDLTVTLANAGVSLPATTLTSGRNLAVTTGGAISQNGILTIAGTSSFNAGSNAITLTQANALTGAVTLLNSGANNVALTNALPLLLATSSVGSGTLALTTNGSMTQSGTLTQAGAGAITITQNASGADVLLGSQLNNLSGAITFAGTLGNIRDVSLRNISSSATLPTNLASLTSLRNLTLQFDNAAMVFPAVTLHSSGNLSAIANGAITQTGIITVPGTATFSTGASPITLAQNNLFTGAVSLTNSGANNVSITNNTSLILNTSSIGQNLTVNANGAISQIGSLSVPGTSSFSAGANAITLTQSNALLGAVSLSNSGANNVAINNSSSLILGTSTVGSGTFSATANGSITQTGALTQASGAGALMFTTTTGGSSILLNQANNLNGAISFGGTLSSISFVTLRNINAAAALPTNIGSLINLHDLIVTFDNAGVILPTLALHAGGSLVIDTSGNLSSGTGGSITQTGALTVPGTASFNAGSHAIVLAQANALTGTVTLNNSGNNNVTLNNTQALNVGASSVGSGTLSLTGLGISQSGSIIQAASAGAVTLNAGAGDLLLTDSGNQFTGAVSLNNSGAHDVSLTNSIALILGTSNVGSGTLTLAGSGSISEVGAITQAANAGGVTLIGLTPNTDILLSTQANNFSGTRVFGGTLSNIRDFAIRNINPNTVLSANLTSLPNLRNLTVIYDNAGIVLPALTLHSGGSISIDTSGLLSSGTGGDIVQSGALTVPGTSTFNAGNHVITLNLSTNAFNGTVSVNNSGSNDVTINNNLALQLAASTIGRNITVTTSGGTGAITQSGALIVGGDASFTTGGTAGSINLSNSSNNFSGAVSVNNSGANDVSVTDSSALVMGASTVGTGNIFLTSGGNISETGAFTQAASGGVITFTFNAPNSDLLFSSQPNFITGLLGAGGTLANLRDFSFRTLGTSGPGIDLQTLTSLRNLTLILDNSAAIFPALTLHNGGNLYVDTSGVLSGGIGGDITQTGTLVVPGTTTLIAGNHGITLTDSSNNFVGGVSISNTGNHDVSLVDASNLIISGAVLGIGNLSLTGLGVSQTGAITQEAGAGAVTINAGAGAIALANAGNNFIGTVSLSNSGANNVALTNNAGLILGTSSVGSGSLALSVNGDLTQTGALTQAGSGAITLTQNQASGDLLLTQANTILGAITIGGTLSNLANFTLRNINATAALPTNLSSLTGLHNLTVQFDNAAVSLPALTLNSGGVLSVTSGGDITQTGVATVAGTASFNAGNHAITLTQNNQFNSAVFLTNGGNNNVALTNAIALIMGTSNVGTGTLSISGFGITQSGAITQAASAGAVTINGGASSINLSNANNVFTGAVSLLNSGANNILLQNSTSLVLGASNVGTGTMGITAGGNITQSGAIIQAASAGTVTLSVTVPNSDILLASQPNNFSGSVVYGGTLSNIRDVARRNVNANAGVTPTNLFLLTNLRNATLIFDNSNAIAPAFTLHNGGSLYVDTSGLLSGGTGGSISQFGVGVVPGTTTLIAGNHSIIITQNNVLTGDVFLSNSGNNNVAVTNSIALSVGTSSVGTGTLSLTGLGVSQTGTITQAGGAGAVTINAGTGAINLSNNNSFTGAISLNNTGVTSVALTNSTATILGTSNVGSGTLAITTGGAITQTGALTQESGAGTFTLAASNVNTDVNLNTQANVITGSITFGGTFANFRDIGLRNTSISAALPTNLNSLSNLRNLSLTFNNTGIAFPALTLHNGGNLIVSAGGAITQTGAFTIPGTSNFSTGSFAINLTSALNDFVGAVGFANVGGNDVSISNNDALQLAASTIGGNFIVTTTGGTGAISQSGALSVMGATSVTAGGSAGSIDLSTNGSANAFTGAISLNNSGANDISLTNSMATIIGSSTLGSGALAITTGGDLTQTGAITQAAGAGTITLAATNANTNIDLSTQANDINGALTFGTPLANIQDFALRNINNGAVLPTNLASLTNLRNLTVIFNNAGISFPTLTLHAGGNLSVNVNGAIVQTGALTVPGSANFVTGAAAITLTDGANAFAGPVSLFNTGSNDVNVSNNAAIQLAASTVGGNLFVTTTGGTGAISQTGSLIVAGASHFSATGTADTITLTDNGNQFIGAVSLSNTGANDVLINNSQALIFDTSTIGGNLTANVVGMISQLGSLTVAGNSSFSAGGNAIDLATNGNANSFTGSVALSNSGSNDVALTNNQALILAASTIGRNLTITANGNISQSGTLSIGGSSSFAAGNNAIDLSTNGAANSFAGAVALSNTGANDVTLTSGSTLALAASSIGRNLIINTSGAISQTGALSVGGTSSFNASSNSIDLATNGSSNSFTGAVSINNSGANNVSIANNGLFTIGSFNLGSGLLNVNAIGIVQNSAIVQAANAGAATFNAGNGVITLTNGTNHFTGAVSLNNSGANNAALVNNTALILGSSLLGTGTLNLTANGVISQTGAIVQSAAAGNVVITQNAVNGDVLLTSQNDFSGNLSFAGTFSNIRDVSLRNIDAAAILPTNIGSLSNLRNLTVTFDNNGIAFPALTTSGNLVATAKGSMTQTGALAIGGTTSLTLTTANTDVLLASAANQFTSTPIIADNGNIRDLALRNITNDASVPVLPIGIRNLTLIFDNNGIVIPTINLGGNLVASAGGAITQSGAIIVNHIGTTASFDAGSNAVTLTNANNDFREVAFTNAGNVNLTTSSALILGSSNVTGTLTLNGAGNLTQSGALSITGATSLSVGANDILLANAANNFSTVSLNAVNANVSDVNDIDLGASTLSGNLTISANGNITQSGTIINNNAGKTATFSANAGNISLTNSNNDFANLAISSANDVTITDANAINLANATIAGNFTLNTTGAITQSGALIVNGASKVTTFNSGSSGDITLTNIINDLNIVDIINARSVSLVDATDLTLNNITTQQNFSASVDGSLTATGLIQTNGGNVNLATTGAGTITIGATPLNIDGILTTAPGGTTSGTITITAANTNNLNPVITINRVLNTTGGAGGTLNLGGGVQLNETPVIGAGDVTLNGSSQSTSLGNLNFTTPTTIQLSNTDIIINGAIITTGAGSYITIIADPSLTGKGGIIATNTGSINSSDNITLIGSDLFASPGTAINLQSGSTFLAAGSISILSNTGNSNMIINGSLQSTGAGQSISVTPSGSGQIQVGANLTTNNGAINLSTNPNSNVTLVNNTTWQTNGGTIAANAIIGAGKTLTLDVGSGTDISFTNANNDFGTVSVTSGRNVQFVDSNNFDLGASTISGTLNISAGGNISNSADVSVTGEATFAANNGNNIDLTQAGNDFSTISITAANNAFIRDTNALNLDAINLTGNLTVTTNGNIIQTGGPIIVNGANKTATFSAGAANDITLTNINNDFTTVAIGSGDDINLRDANAVNLAGIISGNLTIASNGNITQSGALVMNDITKVATLSVGTANDIIFDNGANHFSNIVVNSANNVILNNTIPISFGASTISGNLSTSAPGISQTGILTVTGTSSFNASGDVISLTQNNQFTGAVSLINTGNNNVSVNNAGLLTIGASSVGSGNLTLTSVGIAQNGAITQEANAGNVTINAGAGSINLTNAGNAFTGIISLNNTGANNAAITNSSLLQLGSSTVGANLALTAGGSISQSGAINASGGATTISLTAPNSDILLNTQANNFGTSPWVFAGTIANIRDVAIRNINASSALPSFTGLSNLRNLTVNFDNSPIVFGTTTLTNGGNLVATSGGAITQTGVITVPGLSSFSAGANAINLNQLNQFTGAVTLSNSGNNNVAITNNNALVLNTSSVGSGTLALTGIGVSQIGTITQAAGAGAVTINAGAGAITLNQANNNFTGVVSLNNTGLNNISFVNNNVLTLGTSNVGSGTLSLTTNGSINQVGAITQAANAGTIFFTANSANTDINLGTQANNLSGAITFQNPVGNFRDISLRSINANALLPTNLGALSSLRNLTLNFDNASMALPALTLTSGGNLSVTAGGAITQTGGVTVAGTANFVSNNNAITLTSLSNALSGAVSFATTGANDVAINNNAALQLAASTIGGNFIVSTSGGTGAISQTSALTVGGDASFTAGGSAGSIDLSNSSNIFNGAVAITNSGANNVSVTDSTPLVLGPWNVSTGTLNITSGGSITQTGPITQASTGGGSLNLSVTTPNSDILLASQPNSISGAVLYTGTLSNIRDIGRRNINPNAVTSTTNLALLTNLRNVTLIFDNAGINLPLITLHNGGSLYVDSSGLLSSGTGGNITQSGVITVPGTTTLIAGNHAITVAQNNSFIGDVILSNTGNNNITVNNTVGLSIGASSIGSGTLNLTGLGVSQSGAIVQEAGAGAVTVNAGAGSIDLSNNSNVLTGAISLNNTGANNIALANGIATVIGTSTVGSGTLDLITGGALTQTGALTQASGADVFTISALNPNTDINLSTQANDISGTMTFGGVTSNIRDVLVRNIDANATLATNLVNLTNLRNLTLQFDNSAISLPTLTLTNGGNLSLTAGGAITQTGVLTVPGTASFVVGANAITLTQNNALSGAVSFSNSGNNNVAITNGGALTIGTSQAGSGTLTLTGVGISQLGSIAQEASAGLVTINAGAGLINLTNASNHFTAPVSLNNSGANDVAITNSSSLVLATSTVGSGTFAATANGSITQTGALTQASGAHALTFVGNIGGSDIILDQANNLNGAINFGGNLSFIDSVTLRNVNAAAALPANIGSLTNLANLSIIFDNAGAVIPTLTLQAGGNLSINTSGNLSVGTGGAITQTGVLTVPGTSIFNAGNHAITLSQANVLTGAVTLDNGGNNNVTLSNSIALNIGASNVGSGTLTVTGSGISQSGAIIQAASAGAATFNAGAADLILSDSGNQFTGPVSLNNSDFNDVSITNSIPLVLGTSNIGSGALTITGSGSITQVGAITQAANAGNITLIGTTPNTDILLASQPNNFSGTRSYGGTLSNIRDVGIRNINPNATLSSNLTSLPNVRDITVIFDNAGVVLPALTLNSGGNLYVDTSGLLSGGTGGDIVQSGALTVSGISTFNAGNHVITLNSLANAFAGAVSVNNSGANDVTINNNIALSLATSTIGRNLTVTTTGGTGAITQNGALTVGGDASFTTGGSAGSIDLSNGSNNFSGSVSVNNSGSNNISVTDSSALVMGASTVGTGDISLTSGGSISQTGVFIQADNGGEITFTFNAPNSDLLFGNQPNILTGLLNAGGTLSNVRDVSLRTLNSIGPAFDLHTLTNLRNLTLILDNTFAEMPSLTLHNGGSLYVDTSGTLSGGVGGDITQTGTLVVPGTTTLIAGNHAIALTDGANSFVGDVSLSNTGNHDVSIVDASNLVISNATVGIGSLSLTGVGVSQTGAILQQAGAGAVTINAGAGAIALANAANNFTGAVSLNNSGTNNVALTNNAGLILGASSVGSGNLALVANGDLTQSGALLQAGAGAITLTQNLAGGDILLTQANSLLGAITIGGTLSNVANFTLHNVNANASLPTNLSSLTGLHDFTVQFDNAAVSLPTLTLNTNGALSVTAGGNITQTGIVTVPGTASFNAGNHAITLTQNNQFSSSVSLTNSGNNNVAVTNAIGLIVGSSNVGTGTLSLTGLGVTQSGAIIQAANAGAVTINAGANSINLSSANNTFTGAVSLLNSGANNIILQNSIGLDIGATNVGTGTMSITAGGSITQSGAIIQAASAGTVTLSVTAPNSDILLATQPNNFSGSVVYGGTLSNIRDVGRRNVNPNAGVTSTNLFLLTNLRNATLIFDNSNAIAPAFTLHNGGSLYVDTSGLLSGGTGGSISQVGVGVVPGTTTLIAGNHSIIITQNNVLTGDVFLSNSGNNNIAVNNTVALNIGASSVGSGTLSLTGAGVSQSGAITQVAGAGAVTINAGAGAINLTNNNTFTGAVSLNNSGANNVALTNNTTTVLGTSNIGSGSLAITTGGSLTQTGALTQANGAGLITLAALNANTDVNLNTQANTLTGTMTFGGTLANIRDIGLRNTSVSATLPTNLNTLSNLRNLTLAFDNAGITFSTLTLHNGGNLAATSGGNVTQTGAIAGNNLSVQTNNNAGADISLTNAANNFSTVSLSTTNALNLANTTSNIAYTNAASFSVQSIETAGNINLNSGGAITQSGGITGNSLATQSVNGTILNSGNNQLSGFSAVNTGNGNVQLTNTNNLLTLTGITQSNSGNVSVTNTGALTSNGLISTNGGNVNLTTLTPDASARVLTIGGNIQTHGGNITADSANPDNTIALVVNGLLNTTPGSGGTLTLSGGLSLGTAPIVGAGNITLQGNGLDLSLGTLNFSNSVAFSVVRNIIVTGLLSSDVGADISLTGDNGNSGVGGVQITSTGAVNSGGNLMLQGSSLSNLSINAGIDIESGATLTALGNLTLDTNFNGNIIMHGAVNGSGANSQVNVTTGTGVTTIGANVSANTVMFNNAVVLDAPITITGKVITFANGIGGNQDLTLTGTSGNNSFSLSGPLALHNVTVNGNSMTNNLLSVNSGNFENWFIVGSNAGALTTSGITGNFTFTNIQNLTGGDNGNYFTFANNAKVDGFINGGSLSSSNTLDFSPYTSPVKVTLSTLFSGSVQNTLNDYIARFLNINHFIGSQASTLQLPSAPNTLTFNSALQSLIQSEPTFNNFTHYIATNTNYHIFFNVSAVYDYLTGQVTIQGTPISLVGFNPANFSGDIEFINQPLPPQPPIPPIPPIPTFDLGRIPAILMHQPFEDIFNVEEDTGDLITNEMPTNTLFEEGVFTFDNTNLGVVHLKLSKGKVSTTYLSAH